MNLIQRHLRDYFGAFAEVYDEIPFDNFVEGIRKMLLKHNYTIFSDVDIETILVKDNLVVGLSSAYEFIYCTNRVTNDYVRIFGDYLDEGEIEDLLKLMLL